MNKVDNSKYHTQLDTIQITTENDDTLKYAKDDFNRIVDNHPEFFQDYPDDPDLAYHCNNNIPGEFDSEVGQDYYFILYAYFLKRKNGADTFADKRKRLIKIYSNINSLFQQFEHGGTFFAHQYRRILGYAEYSIFLMPRYEEDISKNYDFTKQKKFYIESLRQLIDDESSIDNSTAGQEKDNRNKKLNEIVAELEKLVKHNFYLRRAQTFQYGHYEYY